MSELDRYGIEWTGPRTPIAVLMKDGYWTPWHLAAEQIAKLEKQNEAILQEAKIKACELDTQKSIVRELINEVGLRVHDYHCTSAFKKALAKRYLEQQAKVIEDAIDAGIDLGIIENDADLCEQLRNQAKGGGV